MKYSLRSLMIVVLVGPPLLAGGWSVWKTMFPPLQRVIPDEDRHWDSVSWEKAKTEVTAADIERLRASTLRTSSAPDPNPPKP